MTNRRGCADFSVISVNPRESVIDSRRSVFMEKVLLLFKIKELRSKILFVLGLLAIFRLSAAIPIPGVDLEQMRQFFENNQAFGLLNIFSGGTLERMSLMMLGVAPYITATIILQLLTMVFPNLKKTYFESGEAGKQKFNQYGRLLTVPLAVVQAFGFLSLLKTQGVIPGFTPFVLFSNILFITAGTIFLMWLGELISEKGIGNGISLIIFAGIVTNMPGAMRNLIAGYDPSQLPMIVIFLLLAFAMIAGVVFINEAQRNIPVTYAKRVRGFKMYGGVSTYLPLRVNMAGVIPIIFALSILLFPQMIVNFLKGVGGGIFGFIVRMFESFYANSFAYGVFYFILVVVFAYFYTAVTFDPKAISSNLQKAGGFIPGIRPGVTTASFLMKIINRITLVGGIFLGFIAVVPFILQGVTGLTALTIGGTSLLIVVSVVLETKKQIEAQLTMREYEKF